MIFPANYEPTKPVQPSEESFYAPRPAIATKRSTILGNSLAIAPVRGNQFDTVAVQQMIVQGIAIVSVVADQSFGEFFEEALAEDLFDELAFVRRSALDTNGERKTVISGDGNDLGAFAALGRANGEPPFFAPEKEASMNPSCNGNWPRACNSPASRCRIFSSLPSRTHCWNRRWQVWNAGYLLGNSRHCAPVPSTHSTPFNTARVSCQGRPRPSLRRAGCRIGSKTDHCSSLTSQRPRIGSWSYQSYHQICLNSEVSERQINCYLFMRLVLVPTTQSSAFKSWQRPTRARCRLRR